MNRADEEQLQPTGVRVDKKQREVTIGWRDGHVSTIGFDGLRLACPCVECKGGHANMGRVPAPETVRNAPQTNVTIEALQPVGSYALQPLWSDGHSTGIYSWRLLRLLAP